jgi:hypothetical protein
MPEVAGKTAAAIEEHAIKKTDMADLPAQRAGNPADMAGACARFFNSGPAFNIKLPRRCRPMRPLQGAIAAAWHS